MTEIRIPVLITGQEAMAQMNSIASGTTKSLQGVDDVSKSLKADLAEVTRNLSAMTSALSANTAALTANGQAARTTGTHLKSIGSTTSHEMTEARHAIKGLGEELGVHMPRFVASFLTSIGGVAPLMASAFSAVAVIGLVEVLASVPEAIDKIRDHMAGWNKDTKEAYDKYLALQGKLAEIDRDHRQEVQVALATGGKKGSAKDHASMMVYGDQAAQDRAELYRLRAATAQMESALKEPRQLKNPGLGLYYGDLSNPKYIGNAMQRHELEAQVVENKKLAENYEENIKKKENKSVIAGIEMEGAKGEEAQERSKKAVEERKKATGEITSYIEKSHTALQKVTDEYVKQLALLKQNPALAGMRPGIDAAYLADWRKANTEDLLAKDKKYVENIEHNAQLQDMHLLSNRSNWEAFDLAHPGISEGEVQGWKDKETWAGANRSYRTQMYGMNRGFRGRMATLNAAPGEEMFAMQEEMYQRQLQSRANYQAALEEANQAKVEDREKIRAEAAKTYAIEKVQIEQDGALKVAEIRRKEMEDYRKTAGEVFDALTAKGGHGLSNFFKAELKTVEKELFVNASGEFYGQFKKAGIGNIIPGQSTTDVEGKSHLTLVGRLLQGTPFAKDQTQNLQLDANKFLNLNNEYTKDNTLKLGKLTEVITGGTTSGSSPAGAGSVLSTLGMLGSVASALGIRSVGSVSGSIASAGSSVVSAADRSSAILNQEQKDRVKTSWSGGGMNISDADAAKIVRMQAYAQWSGASSLYKRGAPFTFKQYQDPFDTGESNKSIDMAVFGSDPDDIRHPIDLTRVKGWPGIDKYGNVTFPKGPLPNKADYSSAAGTVAATGFGAYSGFSRGGVKGDLAGSAALIGGVTTLLGDPAIQKMIGTVASSVPIVGTVLSVGMGLVSSLIGDSAQKRRDQMENEVKGSYDRLPQTRNEQFDITGYTSDITGAGQARTVNIYQSNHIDAIDTKSIVDHWPSIAEAMHEAVNMAHPVVDAIRHA